MLSLLGTAWVQTLLVPSGNVVAALVLCISSLVPGVMEPCACQCWRATGGGANGCGKELSSAAFAALRATILLLEREAAPFTGLFTGGAGQVSHSEPQYRGESHLPLAF